MSVRAIASLLGVGVGTVHREMVALSGVPDGTPDGQDDSSTLGSGRQAVPASAPSSVIDMRHLRGDAPGRYQRLPMGPLRPGPRAPPRTIPRPVQRTRLLTPLSRRRPTPSPKRHSRNRLSGGRSRPSTAESHVADCRCRRRSDGGGGAGPVPAGGDRGPGAARQRHPGGRDVTSERPGYRTVGSSASANSRPACGTT